MLKKKIDTKKLLENTVFTSFLFSCFLCFKTSPIEFSYLGECCSAVQVNLSFEACFPHKKMCCSVRYISLGCMWVLRKQKRQKHESTSTSLICYHIGDNK